MKNIVNQTEQVQPAVNYPIAMISNKQKRVVLFTSKNKGTVIGLGQNKSFELGYNSDTWQDAEDTERWTPFTGTVTLQNEPAGYQVELKNINFVFPAFKTDILAIAAVLEQGKKSVYNQFGVDFESDKIVIQAEDQPYATITKQDSFPCLKKGYDGDAFFLLTNNKTATCLSTRDFGFHSGAYRQYGWANECEEELVLTFSAGYLVTK